MTATAHAEQAQEIRRRAQNRHRNAEELWHLFSHTADPRWQAQIVDEARHEDRAAEHLENAAQHHDDEAAAQEILEQEADARADLNPPPHHNPATQ